MSPGNLDGGDNADYWTIWLKRLPWLLAHAARRLRAYGLSEVAPTDLVFDAIIWAFAPDRIDKWRSARAACETETEREEVDKQAYLVVKGKVGDLSRTNLGIDKRMVRPGEDPRYVDPPVQQLGRTLLETLAEYADQFQWPPLQQAVARLLNDPIEAKTTRAGLTDDTWKKVRWILRAWGNIANGDPPNPTQEPPQDPEAVVVLRTWHTGRLRLGAVLDATGLDRDHAVAAARRLLEVPRARVDSGARMK